MSRSCCFAPSLLFRHRFRRIASTLAAAAFVWVATLATLHALGHAIHGPEPVCSVCLAADHAGQGLAAAVVMVVAVVHGLSFARHPTKTFDSVFRAVYISRAPPSLSVLPS